MLTINQVYQGDCLEVMGQIDDKSIDMILCDLPYGTTACKWDVVIPFEPLWQHYKRIIKDNGAIVLFGSEPFASYLRMSNIKWYKYDWIWNKTKAGNFALGNIQPLRTHEIICMFYNKQCIYNPQKIQLNKPQTRHLGKKSQNRNDSAIGITNKIKYSKKYEPDKKLPISILEFKKDNYKNRLHPTQKPVALCEYLIKTYTNENELVLDNCAGSGTTGIAARNLKRNFILIEKEQEYVNLINKRLSEPQQIKLT